MPTRVVPDLSPESAPVPAEPKLVKPNPIAPADVRSDLKNAPAPVIPVPAHDRLKAAAFRLKDKLTPEMVGHFDLILYVSKAEQRAAGATHGGVREQRRRADADP